MIKRLIVKEENTIKWTKVLSSTLTFKESKWNRKIEKSLHQVTTIWTKQNKKSSRNLSPWKVKRLHLDKRDFSIKTLNTFQTQYLEWGLIILIYKSHIYVQIKKTINFGLINIKKWVKVFTKRDFHSQRLEVTLLVLWM